MGSVVSLTSRDIVSIRNDIINYIKSKEIGWTDFSQSDIGMILIDVIAGVADMLNYYVDAQARECFLSTAEEAKNIRGLLDSYNYPYKMVQPAKGKVKFTLNRSGAESPQKAVTIDRWTQLKTTDAEEKDQIYFVTSDLVRLSEGETEVEVEILQGQKDKIVLKASDLGHSYKYYLGHKDVPKEGVRIIQPDGEWERVDDVFLHTDGGKKFSVHYNPEGEVYILFSFNWLSFLPTNPNEKIEIRFLHSVGMKGEVSEGKIGEVSDNVMDADNNNVYRYLSVTNTIPTFGAADEPDWIKAKANARNYIMSMNRAVTLPDYEGIVKANENVSDAYVADKRRDPARVTSPFEVKAWVVFNDGLITNPEVLAELTRPIKEKIDSVCDVLVDFQVFQAYFEQRNVYVAIDVSVDSRQQQEELRLSVEKSLKEWGRFKNWKMGSFVTRDDLSVYILRLDPRIKRVAIVGFDEPIRCDEVTVPFVNIEKVEVASSFEEETMTTATKVITERVVYVDHTPLTTEDELSQKPSQGEVREATKTMWQKLGGSIKAESLALMIGLTSLLGLTAYAERPALGPGYTYDDQIYEDTPIVTNAWDAIKDDVYTKSEVYNLYGPLEFLPDAIKMGFGCLHTGRGSILINHYGDYPSVASNTFNIVLGIDSIVGLAENAKYSVSVGTSNYSTDIHNYTWGSQLSIYKPNATALGYGLSVTSEWSTVIGHGIRPKAVRSFDTYDAFVEHFSSPTNAASLYVDGFYLINEEPATSYGVLEVLPFPDPQTGMYALFEKNPRDFKSGGHNWNYGKSHGPGTVTLVAVKPSDTKSRGLKSIYINDDSLSDLVYGTFLKKLILTPAQIALGITFDKEGYSENGAVEIGDQASASLSEATIQALNKKNTLRNVAVAIGSRAKAEGLNSIKNQSVAIGYCAHAKGSNAIAIGGGARANNSETDLTGDNAYAGADTSIALGYSTKSLKANSTAIGSYTKTDGIQSTALGFKAATVGSGSVQIGQGTNRVNNSLQFRDTPIVQNGKLVNGYFDNTLDPKDHKASSVSTELTVTPHVINNIDVPETLDSESGIEIGLTSKGSRNYEVFIDNTEGNRKNLPLTIEMGAGVQVLGDGSELGPYDKLPLMIKVREPKKNKVLIDVTEFPDDFDWTSSVADANILTTSSEDTFNLEVGGVFQGKSLHFITNAVFEATFTNGVFQKTLAFEQPPIYKTIWTERYNYSTNEMPISVKIKFTGRGHECELPIPVSSSMSMDL